MRLDGLPLRYVLTHPWVLIRQPGHHCHRLFWGVGYENGGFYRIVWVGFWTLHWQEFEGWTIMTNWD